MCFITVPIELFLKYLIHKSPISDTIFAFLEKDLSPITLEVFLYLRSNTGTVFILKKTSEFYKNLS